MIFHIKGHWAYRSTLLVIMIVGQFFFPAVGIAAPSSGWSSLVFDRSTPAGFVVGDGTQSDFMIIRNGPDVDIYIEASLAYSLDYGTTVTITVNGSDQDDALRVNFSQGNPIPSGGLFYNGYENGVNGDSIQLDGGIFNSIAYEYFNPTDGTIEVDGVLITYTGLEPVIDTVIAATLIVNATNANNAITYVQQTCTLPGSTYCGLVSVDNFETIEFTNKSQLVINGLAGSDNIDIINPTIPDTMTQLTVNAGSGDDVITIQESPAGLSTVTLYGNDGDDTFNVRPSTTATTTVTGGAHFTGDTLTVDPLGANATNTGTAVEVSGYVDIDYSEIEQVFILPLTASPKVDVTCTGPYVPGQTFDCTYALSNDGPNAADNLVLQALWIDSDPSISNFGWDSDWACGADLTCSRLGPMPVAITETINITYILPPDAYLSDPNGDGSFLQCTDLTASNDPSDNFSCWGPYAMTPEATLNVEISDLPDPVDQGDNLIYDIMVRNDGPSDLPADEVELVATLDARLEFMGTSPGCTYAAPLAPATGGTVTCVVPTELAATQSLIQPLGADGGKSIQAPQGAYNFLIIVKMPDDAPLDPKLYTTVSADAPGLNPAVWTVVPDDDSEETWVNGDRLFFLPIIFK